MSRYLKISMWSVLGLTAMLALCVVVLANHDWNRSKPWLNARVSEATGRPFAIRGDLSIQWRRSDAEESTWRQAQMQVSARRMKLKQLTPAFQPMKTSLGELNGDASLSATGNSIAAMLGSSNGEIRAFINGGTVSKLMLEKIGLNIDSIILTQMTGDRQVKLNCMAGDFAVTNGLMQTRSFVVDTDDAILDITGRINLATEQLDLTIKPDTKSLRMISLRAPFYVTGSFKSPKVRVDKGVLALKAGAAVALAVVAPVLTAVLPLVNVGPDRDSDCTK